MVIKKRRRWWIGLRNLFFAIGAVVVMWAIFSNVMTAYEQNKHPAIGQYVEVGDDRMHVYTKGEGEHTIVLLTGLGTPAPALDFEPLLDEMAKNHQVVVVEPFGYGWSDSTNKERSVENIVAEIRTALEEANIPGPYILMPHSISGIYSLYYANHYPEEVEAVIGIDARLPQSFAYFNETPYVMSDLFKLYAPTGLARLAMYVAPDEFLPIAEEGTYSEENLKLTKMITAWKANNRNVVAESKAMMSNSDKTDEMAFPSDMPVLFFTTKHDPFPGDGKNNVTFLETQLTDSPASTIIEREGHHYLHWTLYREMSDAVKAFIQSFPDSQ